MEAATAHHVDPLPTATAQETAAVVAEVLTPLIAKGIIKRRRSVTDLAQRVDADGRAVRRLEQLRDRHGDTTVALRTPGRRIAVVLDPAHVNQVLDETPDPFAAATVEKRAALAHFEPEGVLASQGPERTERRRFNEEVLDFGRSPHRLAEDLLVRTDDEAGRLAALAQRTSSLTYDEFIAAWWRMVRRVVLGDAAADDHVITDQLATLRDDANWAFARPRRRRTRAAFEDRLGAHLAAAEPGSLASMVSAVPSTGRTAPDQQVPQWLFAFDAAGMATYRALALLAAHPDELAAVLAEVDGVDARTPVELPRLRAAVLESLRLWPTTPAILRETVRDADLGGLRVPASTLLLVHAPFQHRHRGHAEADRFAPQLWGDSSAARSWPLVPFSAGPAMCAGRDLVLLLTGAFAASLLQRVQLELGAPRQMGADRPLPGTLSPFGVRFGVRPRRVG